MGSAGRGRRQSAWLPIFIISLVTATIVNSGLGVLAFAQDLEPTPDATTAAVDAPAETPVTPTEDIPAPPTDPPAETQDTLAEDTPAPATDMPVTGETPEDAGEPTAPVATETVTPAPATELTTFAGFAALEAESAMTFSDVQVTPPVVCLSSDTVQVSLTIAQADPTFQGVQVQLFGVALIDETEVLQDAELIAAEGSDGSHTLTLAGDFSATFRRWFVSVRLVDGAGVTQQLDVKQIELDCAPIPVKPGGPMSFTGFGITPPTDCVNPGVVGIAVTVNNPNLAFQGVQVQLFGTTLVGETEVLQDSELVTPDQGAGTFAFDLTGDFSATFQRWAVSARLLDGAGIGQQLDVEQIELDCAPQPVKQTPTSTVPVGVDIDNLVVVPVTDCDSSGRVSFTLDLLVGTGANEEVLIELLAETLVAGPTVVFDSTEIDPNTPAGVIDTALFGSFTTDFQVWTIRATSPTETLEATVPLGCEPGEPGEEGTETPGPTEIPTTVEPTISSTETPTVEAGAEIESLLVDDPQECVAGISVVGTVFLAAGTGTDEEIVLELIAQPAGGGAPVVQDVTQVPPLTPAGAYDFNLFGDFSNAFTAWSIVATSTTATISEIVEPDCGVVTVPTEIPATVTQEPTETPTETPTEVTTETPATAPATTVVTEVPGTPTEPVDEGVSFSDVTIDPVVSCTSSEQVTGTIRLNNPTANANGIFITLFGERADTGVAEVLGSTSLSTFQDPGVHAWDLVGDFSNTYVHWFVVIELRGLRNILIQTETLDVVVDCDQPTETPVTPTEVPVTATVVPPTEIPATPTEEDLEVDFDFDLGDCTLAPSVPRRLTVLSGFAVTVTWANAQPGVAPSSSFNTLQGLRFVIFQRTDAGDVLVGDETVVFDVVAGSATVAFPLEVPAGRTVWEAQLRAVHDGQFDNALLDRQGFATDCPSDTPTETPVTPDAVPTEPSDDVVHQPAVKDGPPTLVLPTSAESILAVDELPVTGAGPERVDWARSIPLVLAVMALALGMLAAANIVRRPGGSSAMRRR